MKDTTIKDLLFMFEYAGAYGHWMAKGASVKRSMAYSAHRVKPLENAGLVELDRKIPHVYPDKPKENYTELIYKPTERGLQWWGKARAEYEEKSIRKSFGISDETSLIDLLATDHNGHRIEWRGIGGEIHERWSPRVLAVILGISEGLFELVRYGWGVPYAWHGDDEVTARLTRSGYEYYSALPRLEDAA